MFTRAGGSTGVRRVAADRIVDVFPQPLLGDLMRRKINKTNKNRRLQLVSYTVQQDIQTNTNENLDQNAYLAFDTSVKNYIEKCCLCTVCQ